MLRDYCYSYDGRGLRQLRHDPQWRHGTCFNLAIALNYDSIPSAALGDNDPTIPQRDVLVIDWLETNGSVGVACWLLLMTKKLSLSVEEQAFKSELIKAGIVPAHAARVAKLLTNALANNSLAPEDHYLIQEVCSQWLSQQR